jgi:hypothetical protein
LEGLYAFGDELPDSHQARINFLLLVKEIYCPKNLGISRKFLMLITTNSNYWVSNL